MSKVFQTQHGRYLLKVMQIGTRFRGVALLGQHKIVDAEAAKRDDCVEALKSALDSRARERFDAREEGVPTSAEFLEALEFLAINDATRRMLAAHRSAPDQTLSAAQLAAAAGYKKLSSATSKYSELGHSIADHLGWEPPGAGGGAPVWVSVLAEPVVTELGDHPEPSSPEFRWRLRPQLAAALEMMSRREVAEASS